MILSRSTTSSKISTDTSASSSARPHLGTSSLPKFKRRQDFHCSFSRTWGKYHSTKKDLILCAAAAATEATVDMSLKADAEPNNNVSIEEEVSFKSFFVLPSSSCAPDFNQVVFILGDTPVRLCVQIESQTFQLSFA